MNKNKENIVEIREMEDGDTEEDPEIAQFIEEEILSSEASLMELRQQSMVRRNFSDWMGVIQNKNDEVTQKSGGKYSLPPVLHMKNLSGHDELNEELRVEKDKMNDMLNCAKIEI